MARERERLRAAAILAGGATGTVARGGMAEALPHAAGTWPWATFAANILGALLLGWLTARLATTAGARAFWLPLLGPGLCGALTTFSTFQVEVISLAGDGHAPLAAAYAATSLTAGMAAATAGTLLARRRWPS